MRKKILILAALAATIAIAGFVFSRPLGEALFERAAQDNLGRDSRAGLGDGLHIGLCGTGSPMPNPDRAGPCNLVIAGKTMVLIDAGEGASRNLALMGFDSGQLDAVFLTHFHSDHIDGLGPIALMRWVRGAHDRPLDLFGAQGVEQIAQGFNDAYRLDSGYRTAHHGEAIAPPSGSGFLAKPFALEGSNAKVFERDGLTITAFRVNHDPVRPALGYRFDYKGRSACISGDTVRSANLEAVCKGVDLLVHEALQPKLVGALARTLTAQGNRNGAKIMRDILEYHASPEDAARSAKASGAKALVLSHLVPPLPIAYLGAAFLGDAAQYYDGPITIGEDGMLFSLEAGRGDIDRRELM